MIAKFKGKCRHCRHDHAKHRTFKSTAKKPDPNQLKINKIQEILGCYDFGLCDENKALKSIIEVLDAHKATHKSSERCPKCNSPEPHLHPSAQQGGICTDRFHLKETPSNKPELIQLVVKKRRDTNGGIYCDVKQGHCSCGAYH